MRLEIPGSLICFVWTEDEYRHEVVRLFKGINRSAVKLVRARRVLGLAVIVVRRNNQPLLAAEAVSP